MTIAISRSGRTAARVSSEARRWLPVPVVLVLPLAWWLSLILVADTPALDLTPPKVLVLVMLGVLLASRPRIAIPKADGLILGLLGAYCVWLMISAVVRGSTADLKMTLGYALYFGGPLVTAYVAGRRAPHRFSRIMIGMVAVALAVTFAGVVLERLTYPGLGQPDPLAGIWQFVRPQNGIQDAVRGTLTPPALHFSSGDPAIPRVSSWFAHVNYLAFFCVLTAALAATMFLNGLRRRRRGWTVVAGMSLVASTVIVVWTYSRVGLVGLFGVVVAVVVVDVLARSGRGGSSETRLAWIAPGLLVLLTVGVTLGVDQIGLNRFSNIAQPPPAVPSPGEATVPSPGEATAAIEASARRSAALRLAMQKAALDLITASPRTLMLGPGQAVYELAIHEPSSPHYIVDAVGFRDSNSLWLTLAVAGGVPAALLMAIILLTIILRLLRVIRRGRDGLSGVAISWMAVWFPVWAVMQFFGTFPFVASEAIILGTMLGTAIGVTNRDGYETAAAEAIGAVSPAEG